MLSKSAFNALLKTLEEPPEHAVFILATTDADKLPATILSRVQRFNFRTISQDEVAAHLRTIADAEQISIDDDALQLIARYGQGSFRDSISLLDQMRNLSSEKITAAMVEDSLGLASTAEIRQLLEAYCAGDLQTIADTLRALEYRGVPANAINEQLLYEIRSDIINKSNCLPLADKLLSNQKTAWPYVKLLIALSSNTNVSNSDVSAASTPAQPESAQPMTVNEPAPVYAPQPASDTPQKKKKNVQPNQTANFDWSKFLEAVHAKSTGAYSYLAKSGYELDDQQLTIFTGKKFAKNQIEKSLPVLAGALQAQKLDREIIVSAKPKPPKDSQTAAILDIMGGGEEVNL